MSSALISLQLNLQQGNLILEALAERPFKLVFELIGMLNQQAAMQLPSDTETGADNIIHFELSAAQLRLVIEALGDLPYNRVHQLLAQLHQQLANISRSTRGDA